MAEPTDYASDSTAPALSFFSITPDDDGFLPHVVRGLYVGTGGDIVATPRMGADDVVFVGVPSGTILPIVAVAVRETGTTAANIVGLQ